MIGDYVARMLGPEKPASVSVEVEMGSEEYEPTDAEVIAAADVIAASKSGDAKKLARALHDAYLTIKACCESHEMGGEGMGEMDD